MTEERIRELTKNMLRKKLTWCCPGAARRREDR